MTEPAIPEEITFTGGPLDGITVRRDGNSIVVVIGEQHVRYGPDGEFQGEVG